MFKKILIFIILFVLSFLIIYLYGYIKTKNVKTVEYIFNSNDNLVTGVYVGTYSCTDDFCYNEKENITNYFKNFKKSEFKNLNEVGESYIVNAKKNYDSFKEYKKPTSYSVKNKNIYKSTYVASMNGIDYIFIVSSIEYDESDIYSLSVFVISKTSYKLNVESIDEAINSLNIIKKSN